MQRTGVNAPACGHATSQIATDCWAASKRTYVYTYGTKSLTVTGEAYERLKEHKRDDERFTETILRLTGAQRDLMDGFGAMADVDGFRESVRESRAALDEDLRERDDR